MKRKILSILKWTFLTHAAGDKNFKSLFQWHFSDKHGQMDIGKSYTQHLKSLTRSSSSGDFIDDRSIHGLANEINKLLDEGRLLIEKSNFINAFILARSVLTEVIEIITYYDDSSGYIGDIINSQALLQENLDIVDVRRGEVSRLVEERDFVAAKKLIIEGIEIARKKDHPGTVTQWEKALLQIAVLEKDIEKIRYYTKHFAFDRGFNLIFYNQWKSSFDIAEWEQEIEIYLEEIITRVELKYQKDKGKLWYSPNTLLLGLLAPIYIEEKYWDRLLSLVSNEIDLNQLTQYHDYLLKIYPIQLLALYIPAFERKGDKAGNRREYADLAIKMMMVIETIPEGKDEIISIAEELCRKYPRRPAMIDELYKVIKIRN
jgi:hypothetical protein